MTIRKPDVMILAAGRGERMRPLTDHIPKPLLTINGKAMIVGIIEMLKKDGYTNLVINYAHLGDQIVQLLGDGQKWGVQIKYSPETEGGLETGGGVFNALHLLNSDPFIIVNADIWTDFPFRDLRHDIDGLAHLVMVDNPSHHPEGDFCLRDNTISETCGTKLTYSGIALLKHNLFSECQAGVFPLAPLFRSAMEKNLVTGEHYHGIWKDIGTPERLLALTNKFAK